MLAFGSGRRRYPGRRHSSSGDAWPEKSLGWWNIAGLGVLTLLSYALEFGSGYSGAKRFGATKWGAFGATIGTIVGLFYPFPGLLVGPLVGAIAGELLAETPGRRGPRRVGDGAGKSGWVSSASS